MNLSSMILKIRELIADNLHHPRGKFMPENAVWIPFHSRKRGTGFLLVFFNDKARPISMDLCIISCNSGSNLKVR
jgi:hypothetical protein